MRWNKRQILEIGRHASFSNFPSENMSAHSTGFDFLKTCKISTADFSGMEIEDDGIERGNSIASRQSKPHWFTLCAYFNSYSKLI